MLARAAERSSNLEKDSVPLSPNLGKVDGRGRRGNKFKTMARALFRAHGHIDVCGCLEKITRKLIRRVAESDDAPCYSTPSKVE